MLDVWDWDGATGTWRDRTPTSSSAARPEVRSGFGMAVDDRRGTIWLFGGDAGAKGLLSDLWEWD
ncbi:MAG TPA: kelch repeat-containing protein, partial [Polyangia bacterium]|nr:kelch repeat-containing protein [Polyangia bacterium]